MCSPSAPPTNPAARVASPPRTDVGVAPTPDVPNAAQVLDQRYNNYVASGQPMPWTANDPGIPSPTAPNPAINPAARATSPLVAAPIQANPAARPSVISPTSMDSANPSPADVAAPAALPTYSTKPLVMNPLPSPVQNLAARPGATGGGYAGGGYSAGSAQDLVTQALMRNVQRGYY